MLRWKPLRPLLLALFALVFASTASAQVQLGADLMSRYVWRGYDFGESFSIQPTLEFGRSGFAVGTWASYSIAADGAGANEHDLYASYTSGPVTVGVTDYYFPSPPDENGVPDGAQFFNYDGDGRGAHYIEPFVQLTGPEPFPVSFLAALVAHNDPDHSVYLEASYPFAVADTDLSFTAGLVPMESGFYGTDGAALVNVGLSASQSIPLTDRFSLPVSVSYVLNPYMERTFLVFGISL